MRVERENRHSSTEPKLAQVVVTCDRRVKGKAQTSEHTIQDTQTET
jgi:hypothetical protein